MKIALVLLVSLLWLGSSAARAQASLHLSFGWPPGPPPMAVLGHGIRVVEGIPEEVFLDGGWYWCRRPNGWYRARSPRAPFVWVAVGQVPRGLVLLPAGHYRHWHRHPVGYGWHRHGHRGHHRRLR